ncbi:MAG: hypothetical protein K0S65_3272 [Labilithrix sp.]|nr:hypothetical protein [Labilithrix sp.]
MRSERDGRPRTLGGVLVLLFFLFFPRNAGAASAPVHVVIRTIVPLDEALYERTVGQVSDLPAELEPVPSAALEGTMSARLESARAIALQHHATMVVWFEHPTDAGPVVVVALPARDRVLVRPIAEPNESMSTSTSAMLEASALVVRTALLALESGLAVGVPSAELTHEPKPPATPTAPPPVPKPPPPPRRPSLPAPAVLERPHWSLFAGAGWQLTFDGRSPAGARAGLLEAGVRHGDWSGSLRGSLGLPSRSHDDLVSLEVWRHSAGIFVGHTLARGGPWRLDGGAGLGLVVFERSAYPRDSRFSPSPPITHLSAAASLELRVLWSPSATFPVHLGMGAGVDALSAPPSFSYETASGVVDRPSWFIEPRLMFVASFTR